MKKDPVCGMQVDEKKAPATSMHKGEHFAFCGQECKDKFDQNPERYAHSKQESSQQQREPQHSR
jgi:YHS domain-containing protein